MEKNEMKEYRQPKVTVVNFKVERAIAESGICTAHTDAMYGLPTDSMCYE